MKSQYVDMLYKVVKGILKDASSAYPAETKRFSRDFVRITRLIEDRGIGLFQLDLPNLDDVLTDGLQNSSLTLSGALVKRVSGSVHVPRLFSGLWLKIFSSKGSLLEDADVNAILFLRQLCCVGKKVELPCSLPRVRKCVDEYYTIDQGLRSPSLNWLGDDLGSSDSIRNVHFCDIMGTDMGQTDLFGQSSVLTEEPSDRELLTSLQSTADELSAAFGAFNAISASCEAKSSTGAGRGYRHGPGAVAHKSGIVDKYAMPYLTPKLLSVFPRIFMIPRGDEQRVSNHEVPSRLIAVPKTAKAPRLIAAEPAEHQWCQQLLLDWFTRRIPNVLPGVIDLSSQDESKLRAQRGSLDQSLATVDLSSASDRLSCWVVERAFRSNPSLLQALHACRTRWLSNSIAGTRPYFLKLRKYASQGTATTFPVQSIVFATIALACLDGHSLSERLRRYGKEVRVYGDDIIIPTYAYARLVRLLTLLQLKVNDRKSFSTGYFRESCGGDYFRGYDVTPVKAQRLGATKPGARIGTVETSNNFFTKGFWHTADAIMDLIGYRKHFLPVVQAKPDKSSASGPIGLTAFSGSWYAHLDMRWHAPTSTVQYRAYGPSSKVQRYDRTGRSRLRKFLLENPIRHHLDSHQYDSDMLGRGTAGDRISWRALEPLVGFRANRYQ